MRRGRPDAGALPLGALLEGALPAPVKQGLSLADLTLKWESVAGPFAAKSRPLRVEGDLLVVIVESPALAQRFKIQSGGMARKIKEGWGLPVKGLRIIVGPVLKKRKKPPPRSQEAFQFTREELMAAKRRVAPFVRDETISSALARLLAVYGRRFGRTSPGDGIDRSTKE
ncbi:MAG: DUF721 domain-containing protein [Synergistales bacterium]|nr:DUF721 domain-containing protein [Synergistales bacterium]